MCESERTFTVLGNTRDVTIAPSQSKSTLTVSAQHCSPCRRDMGPAASAAGNIGTCPVGKYTDVPRRAASSSKGWPSGT